MSTLCQVHLAWRRAAVAREIAKRYNELTPYLNSDRNWKEEYYHNIFDAVALGVAALQ